MKTKKILALALAAVLLVAVGVGGTLAWLQDTSSEVKNTFTTSTIDVELTETKPGSNGGTAQMVPGATIEKDPKVTVTTPDVDAWLFVEITESDNLDTYISYAIADGWKYVDGYTQTSNPIVIYREVSKKTEAQDFYVLKDNKVTVNGASVTKEMMGALTEATYPTLTFKAYVVQKDATIADATAAWAIAKPASN